MVNCRLLNTQNQMAKFLFSERTLSVVERMMCNTDISYKATERICEMFTIPIPDATIWYSDTHSDEGYWPDLHHSNFKLYFEFRSRQRLQFVSRVLSCSSQWIFNYAQFYTTLASLT